METFTIHVTFFGGGTTTETHSEDTLVSAVHRLTRGPAAASGLVREVKVVDQLDCTNFSWRDGKLIFPIKGIHC